MVFGKVQVPPVTTAAAFMLLAAKDAELLFEDCDAIPADVVAVLASKLLLLLWVVIAVTVVAVDDVPAVTVEEFLAVNEDISFQAIMLHMCHYSNGALPSIAGILKTAHIRIIAKFFL